VLLKHYIKNIICRCKRREKDRKIHKSHQTTRINVLTQSDQAKNTLIYAQERRRNEMIRKAKKNLVSPSKRKFKPTWINRNEWQ